MKRSILIGKRKYKIKKVDMIEENPDILGKIQHNDKLIYLKKEGNRTENSTLYHELTHGIIVDLAVKAIEDGAEMKYIKFLDKLNNNEPFVQYFSNILRSIFKIR